MSLRPLRSPWFKRSGRGAAMVLGEFICLIRLLGPSCFSFVCVVRFVALVFEISCRRSLRVADREEVPLAPDVDGAVRERERSPDRLADGVGVDDFVLRPR